MLSRSRRPDLMVPSQTSAGPGSYDPTIPSFKPKSGMAPFCSTTERKTIDMPQFATPGPGAYAAPQIRHLDIRPSPQFMSKEPRIAAEKERLKALSTPGPGAYTAELVKPPQVRQAAPPSGSDRHGLAWVKIATVPSIPAAGQSYGYEEGKAGELVQQAPPFVGHSGKGADLPGPGEYDPKLPGKGPKGTCFAKSTGTRLSVVPREIKDNPGPGAYRADECSNSIQFHGGVMAKRPGSMFASTTARSKLSASSDAPGPGQYKPKSTFTSLREYLASNPESFHAFGSSGKQPHVEVKRGEVPGPGAYAAELPRSKTFGKASAAFASASTRFGEQRADAEQPGPGMYEIGEYTFTRELGKKLKGKYGAFGSSSSRFEHEKPQFEASPASYTISESNPAELRRKDKRMAAFRSSAVRKDTTPMPCGAPTFYDAKIDWQKPSTTSKSFITTVPRFKEAKRDEVPGPGQYEQKQTIAATALSATQPAAKNSFGTSPRFQRAHAEHVPGPGSYNTTPSMIKSTFNITIGDAWE